MLQEVIDLQQTAITDLCRLIEGGSKRELTFRAPTGSGKTHMMSDLMSRVLSENEDVVFIVSTLSKGELSKQNYDYFCSTASNGTFPNLCPYLINTESSGEESLFISPDYNVYVLPRDLVKENGLLMQGPLDNFLMTLRMQMNKRIVLIKDECHIATSNLDAKSNTYFERILNFSATPKLSRKQDPDVSITDDDAVRVGLIKRVEWGDESDTVENAICKFEEVKKAYRNDLHVNPCLIIQISNADKAEEEWSTKILPVLNKEEHQHLKWMVIVDKNANLCSTNDSLGAGHLSVDKWKSYARQPMSTIDIIVFKMVISEGWDIPRACMLYQLRDSKSKQLDEQVIGRVRRNPRLLDFETLSESAKQLALTAWVWGIAPVTAKKYYPVNQEGYSTACSETLKIKTTRLRSLNHSANFDLEEYLSKQEKPLYHKSIFELYDQLQKCPEDLRKMCMAYGDKYEKWIEVSENIDGIRRIYNNFICDYDESMEVVKEDSGIDKLVSFPIESAYLDNGNYIKLSNWIWHRKDGHEKFSFDSEAERSWAEFLCGIEDNFAEIEPADIDSQLSLFEQNASKKKKRVWGKNFPLGTEIKYEYYKDGIHTSYPDFIMQDAFGRIHIFEVKSLNTSSSLHIDSAEYHSKVKSLSGCYLHCSKLTDHYFYLPILKDEKWELHTFYRGQQTLQTEEQFKRSLYQEHNDEPTELLIPFDVEDSEKYTSYLPLYSIHAACGHFLDNDDAEIKGWIDVKAINPTLSCGTDYFIVQAKGDSMIPQIQDGDYCVFQANPGGSRNKEIMLFEIPNRDDNYGGSYTIKKYTRVRTIDEDDESVMVELRLVPLNPKYQPMVYDESSGSDIKAAGVFKYRFSEKDIKPKK